MKLLLFLFFCAALSAMQKDQELTPLDRLSILHAIANGNLIFSNGKYTCESFAKTGLFCFTKKKINPFFQEMLDTKTPSDLEFDSEAYDRFTNQHPEVQTSASCSPRLQIKYFNVYLHALKHDYDCEENFHTYLKAAIKTDSKTMRKTATELRANACHPNHRNMVIQVCMLRKITNFIVAAHD